MVPTHVQTILVVDADGTLLDASLPTLVERGYRVHHAADAGGALWILRHVAIDLVLLDGCVPDAWELLELKANDPRICDVRVVLVTVGAAEIAPQPGRFHEAVAPTTH